ncbi:uncharacterized protein LOC116953907 isoform X1 [Petromyzon marinus]|uniref:uncharacterized protein LOC116953907 isoform X1 n=2 Tax=Petromyzon marinus TaxID=7757 RepID=UPI003F712321
MPNGLHLTTYAVWDMGCNSSKSATVVDSADKPHPPAHEKATKGKNPDDKAVHTDGAAKAQDDHDQKPDNPSDKQKEEGEKEKDIPPQEAQDSKEETPRSKGD